MDPIKRFAATLTLAVGTLGLLLARPALAFNSDNCAKTLRDLQGQETLQPYTWTMAHFESSSQFSSTWGGCSGFGMMEQRKTFIELNAEGLMAQIAEGRGELIETLAALSGCAGSAGAAAIGQGLQRDFRRIYSGSAKETTAGADTAAAARAERVSTRIDRLISADPTLRQSCRLLTHQS